MTRSRLVIALFATVATGLSGLAACSRSASKAADSTTASTTRGALMARAPIDTLVPGALPMPIDSMSGDAFQQLVRGLHFSGGGVYKRPCTGRAGCDGPSPHDTTVVSIDGVQGEDSLVISRIPATGAVVAVLVNRGRWEEKLLHLRSDSAHFKYYLVAYPGSSDSTGTWRLEQLERQGNTVTHTQVSTGRLVGCMHAFNPTGPRAAFRTCADAQRMHVRSLVETQQTLTSTGYTSTPWIACASGCCVAQPA